MASESEESPLIGWYRSRIGHPTNRNEVYGYWLFTLGGVLALLGGVWIVVRAGGPRGSREFGFVLVMVGAVALLAGGTLRLPLSGMGTRLTQVGGVVAMVGVAGFSVVFPQDWVYGGGEIPLIGAAYLLGLGVMTLAPVITPMVSEGPTAEELADRLAVLATQHEELTVQRDTERAEAGAKQEAELSEATAAAATAETRAGTETQRADTAERRLARIEDSQATFEVYKDRADEWRWRLVHQNRNIIATSGEGYSSDRTARRGLRSVRRNAPGADAVWLPTETEPEPTAGHVKEPETTQASVELFEDDGGSYRWGLRHDNGQLLAIAARGYASRSNARDGVAAAQRVIGPAEYLTFDPAGFEVYQDAAGEYRWRLVAANGQIIAAAGEGYTTRSDARRAVETVRETATATTVDGTEGRRFDVYEDDGGDHRWRLVATNGTLVATAGEGYTTHADAREAADRVQRYAPEANAITVGDAAVELFEDEEGDHRWRLRHRNGRLLAMAADGFASRANAVQSLNSVKRNLPNAPRED